MYAGRAMKQGPTLLGLPRPTERRIEFLGQPLADVLRAGRKHFRR